MVTAMIRCLPLFTGADGRSPVEETPIPLHLVQASKAVHFEEAPTHLLTNLQGGYGDHFCSFCWLGDKGGIWQDMITNLEPVKPSHCEGEFVVISA